MSPFLSRVFGPRVSPEFVRADRMRYSLPPLMLSLARIALVVSVFLPYWHMTLEAPQYPEGLELTAYVNQLVGDVREIDGLNHYIGMRKLNDAASLERAMGVWMVIAMLFLVEGAALVHSRWASFRWVFLWTCSIGFTRMGIILIRRRLSRRVSNLLCRRRSASATSGSFARSRVRVLVGIWRAQVHS